MTTIDSMNNNTIILLIMLLKIKIEDLHRYKSIQLHPLFLNMLNQIKKIIAIVRKKRICSLKKRRKRQMKR